MDLSPIVIVEDDLDDHGVINEAAERLKIKRQILFLESGDALLSYLERSETAPFMIICDFNMPVHDGLKIKKRVDNNPDLKHKGVPFILWTSTIIKSQVLAAYELPAHGFFVKDSDFDTFCDTFQTIISYWEKSLHPKEVD